MFMLLPTRALCSMNEDSQERAAMGTMKVKSVNVLSRALRHDGAAAVHQADRLATRCNFQRNIARDVCNDKSPSKSVNRARCACVKYPEQRK